LRPLDAKKAPEHGVSSTSSIIALYFTSTLSFDVPPYVSDVDSTWNTRNIAGTHRPFQIIHAISIYCTDTKPTEQP